MDHVSSQHQHDARHDERGPGRRLTKRAALLSLCVALAALFAGLGVWQLERRTWKLDLIARVDARLQAAPVPLPVAVGRADEYRRIRVTGRFLHEQTTLVDALTERGAGAWLMTPFATDEGLVLVNRGFVPDDAGAAVSQPAGPVTISGLVRLSEPGGRVLRPNQPAADRWFSRDVEAIARRRGLGPVLPVFIDADRVPGGGLPIGGMTVVAFRNTHLVYALTWFALAGIAVFGAWRLQRETI